MSLEDYLWAGIAIFIFIVIIYPLLVKYLKSKLVPESLEGI